MITLIFGTRADAIKVGPIAAELTALQTPWRAFCTGQHRELLAGTPAETDLADATSLGLASDGDVLRWRAKAERVLLDALPMDDDPLVVVQGDTMSAMAGAQAAHVLHLPLAHVEAGIRSHRLTEPWPEEGFRVQIDQWADWCYAPTSTAFMNLMAEGIVPRRIRTTGNTGVSALARYSNAMPIEAGDYAVVTLHRREWLHGPNFHGVLAALEDAVADCPKMRFLWPMHPAVEAKAGRWVRQVPNNLVIMRPVPYRAATTLLAGSFGVLTDSGGLQEEAAVLGVPCAVLRNVLDRPESVEAGVARRFDVTPSGVEEAVHCLTTGLLPRRVAPVFGGADAAAQVARHLASLAEREYTSV